MSNLVESNLAPGDAKQDWWIIQEIANRMGLSWNHSEPKDIFSEMREVMPSLNGITWDRLERESAVTYPCEDEFSEGYSVIFSDGYLTESDEKTRPMRHPTA